MGAKIADPIAWNTADIISQDNGFLDIRNRYKRCFSRAINFCWGHAFKWEGEQQA